MLCISLALNQQSGFIDNIFSLVSMIGNMTFKNSQIYQDGIVKVTRLPRYTLSTVREEKASYRRCSSMIKNLASGFLDELQLAS